MPGVSPSVLNLTTADRFSVITGFTNINGIVLAFLLIFLSHISTKEIAAKQKRQSSLNTGFQESTAPKHGGNGGVVFTVVCPNNGVITGIDVRSGNRIDQIKLTCKSSEGITSFGPYGANCPSTSGTNCPEGYYISSIYGRSGSRLDQLGMRCRKENDMNSQGQKSNFTFGGSGGAAFDDNSYSIGFRPTAIKIWAGSVVDAIQVTYGNLPVALCKNCIKNSEEWAPQHGGNGSTLYSFVCPNEGVITGIDVRSGGRVDQIKFTCTSSLGKTTFGPYGGGGGSGVSDQCLPGYFIDSIHGRSGDKLDKIGIRCVKSSRSIGLNRDGWGGNGGADFDDQQYSQNNKRPIRVRAGTFVDAIQIKYGILPVALDCQVTQIQVTDKATIATYDGLEVVGISSGFSCAPGTSQLQLQSTQSREETIGIEVAEGGEINLSTSVSLSYTYGVQASIGVVAVTNQVSVGLTPSVGGSKSWSNTKSTSASTGTQNSQGIYCPFEGPGSGVCIGYLNRYIIDRDNVPVLYHLTCAKGSLAPQSGKIKLTSKSFGDTKFQAFSYKFNGTDKCTDNARSCVNGLRVGTTFSDPLSLRKQFFACFPAGSGEAFKK